VDGETQVYNFYCLITNATAATNLVSSFHNVSFGENFCGCELPPTPTGKYLSGYNLLVQADVGSQTADLQSCQINPLYQDRPPQNGDEFTQIVSLEDTSFTGPSSTKYFIIFGVIISILIIGSIVLNRYYRSLPSRPYTQVPATEMEANVTNAKSTALEEVGENSNPSPKV